MILIDFSKRSNLNFIYSCPGGSNRCHYADLEILWAYDTKIKNNFFFFQISKWDTTQINKLILFDFFDSKHKEQALAKYNKYINTNFIL